jgi:hypothetical protein
MIEIKAGITVITVITVITAVVNRRRSKLRKRRRTIKSRR